MKIEYFKKSIRVVSDLVNDYSCKRFIPTESRNDDLWIVEFPKSGVTWVSFIIANVANEMRDNSNEVRMFNVTDYVPDIHMTKRLGQQMLWPYYRIIKSHSYVNRRYLKVLYLVRNPMNVMLSYYKMVTGIGWWNGSISEFIRHKRYGIKAWVRHVDGWYVKSKYFNKMCFIKYEDLREDTACVIKNVFDCVGLSVPENIVEKAIDKSSIANMRTLEKKQNDFDLRKNADLNSKGGKYLFVGKGEVKTSNKDFSDADYKFIKNVADEYGRIFGYW